MIIKGKSRSNAGQAGNYLTTKGKNERVELIETRGTMSADVKGATQEMEALAAASNAQKPFYHASINPAKGEHLTSEQWEKAVNLLEKKLGLENNQRIVVEHEKDGRTHRHILWGRVDPESLKAVRMGWNYIRHEETARLIENVFDLEKTQGVFNRDPKKIPRPVRAPSHNEIEQGKKDNFSVAKWRKECKALAATTDGSGAALIKTLENQGHFIARGDKMARRGSAVPVVVLDPAGNPHRLSGTIGLRKAGMEAAFENVDISTLPSVKEAQKRQKERQEKEKQAAEIVRAATMYDSGGMVNQQRDALRDVQRRTLTRNLLILQQKKEAFKGAKERAERGDSAKPKQYKVVKSAPSREEIKEKSAPLWSQRESLKKDVLPQQEKKDRTEQTDRKQRQSAKDIMKEIFDKGREAIANRRQGLEKDNSWDRERER